MSLFLFVSVSVAYVLSCTESAIVVQTPQTTRKQQRAEDTLPGQGQVNKYETKKRAKNHGKCCAESTFLSLTGCFVCLFFCRCFAQVDIIISEWMVHFHFASNFLIFVFSGMLLNSPERRCGKRNVEVVFRA